MVAAGVNIEKQNRTAWEMTMSEPRSAFRIALLARIAVLAALALAPARVRADIRLAACFGDNMVLQQGRPAAVWGWAENGDRITVTFAGRTKTARAGDDGKWMTSLDALAASNRGRTLVVKSAAEKRELRISNVVVGEVWLCSGQSNMYWPVRLAEGGREAMAGGDKFPDIRILNYQASPYGGGAKWSEDDFDRLTPGRFMQGKWEVCSSKAAGRTSAVGFFMALELHKALKTPVGLIHASKGGTPCESWIHRDALANHKKLKTMLAGDWFSNETIGSWCRQRARRNLGAWFKRVQADRAAGRETPYRKRPTHPFEPGAMWSRAIERLAPAAIAGVAWYQGESNAETPADIASHDDLLRLLITDWRKQWDRKRLPFLIVQLPRIDSPGRVNWPAFRASQARVAGELPDVWMAVALDLGDNRRRGNVHPPDKKPVGKRLALIARKMVYGQDVPHAGPEPKAVRAAKGKLAVSFETGGSELVLRDDPNAGKTGFELAGEDGKYHPARARVIGRAGLEIGSPAVRAPKSVRYGWDMWPAVTLYNASGLPAGPFQLHVAGAAEGKLSVISNGAAATAESSLPTPLFELRRTGRDK